MDVADGPEPCVIGDDERDRPDVPRRMRRDERRPVRIASHRAARVEDRAGRVVDRVNVTCTVVGGDGSDERVEVVRSFAAEVYRQAYTSLFFGPDVGTGEPTLRD